LLTEQYPACLLTLEKHQILDDLPQTTINKAINDFRKRLIGLDCAVFYVLANTVGL